MTEAFEELSSLAEEAGVAKFKSASEAIISRKLHFGLGRWISINWNLEEGSRYEYYLRNLGLTKVDHMIQFTIVSWHRHLLGKDLEVEARVTAYQKELEEELEARKVGSQLIKKEKRAIPRND